MSGCPTTSSRVQAKSMQSAAIIGLVINKLPNMATRPSSDVLEPIRRTLECLSGSRRRRSSSDAALIIIHFLFLKKGKQGKQVYLTENMI